MRITNEQLQTIIQMRIKGFSLEEISKKTNVPMEEIKIILKIKK